MCCLLVPMARSSDSAMLLTDSGTSVAGSPVCWEPPVPVPTDAKLQVITSTHPVFLAFLALQVRDARGNRALVIRMIASAVMHIFDDNHSMIEPYVLAEPLTGLEVLDVEGIDDMTVINTNVRDGIPLTASDLHAMCNIDEDELASYFGILFLAGVERRTGWNRETFTVQRAPAVQALTVGPLRLFNVDSGFLADSVLDSVHASFNSIQSARNYLIWNTASRVTRLALGTKVALARMFMLIEDLAVTERYCKEGKRLRAELAAPDRSSSAE